MTDLSNISAPTLVLLSKLLLEAAKDKRDELGQGSYMIAETIVIETKGTISVGANYTQAPTCSIPMLPTLALFIKRMGFPREKVLDLLCEVMTEALELGEDASEKLLAESGVTDALKLIRKRVIANLPRTPVNGKVTINGTLTLSTDDDHDVPFQGTTTDKSERDTLRELVSRLRNENEELREELHARVEDAIYGDASDET